LACNKDDVSRCYAMFTLPKCFVDVTHKCKFPAASHQLLFELARSTREQCRRCGVSVTIMETRIQQSFLFNIAEELNVLYYLG
jgi:hypothetical protein